MSSRQAGSVLLNQLGPRVFGPAAPTAAAPSPLLALAGGGQWWARQLSISSSESRADVAEVYAAKKDYASAAKVEMAIIAASEARADVAEVFAAKVDYASAAALKAEVAIIAASESLSDVAEVYASKEDYSTAPVKAEVLVMEAAKAKRDDGAKEN
jgi:hypothetical protein